MELHDEIVYQYLQKHRRVKMLIDIEGKKVEVFERLFVILKWMDPTLWVSCFQK